LTMRRIAFRGSFRYLRKKKSAATAATNPEPRVARSKAPASFRKGWSPSSERCNLRSESKCWCSLRVPWGAPSGPHPGRKRAGGAGSPPGERPPGRRCGSAFSRRSGTGRPRRFRKR
jgi:hypothetical protein